MVVLTGSGVGRDRDALARLQQLIARQPDVAQVLGPRQQLLGGRVGFATARRGNAARYVVFLDSDPLGPRAISAVRGLRGRLPGLLTRAGLTGATPRVGGDTAISADIVGGTVTSLERVIPTVLTGIFVVIAIFLQALVAPIYLVLTSLLAVIATLGLTVYVMQMLLGYGQITYYVLFTVAVLLISLGSDYNVFVVGRIWQEGRRRPLRDAVEVAGTRAARPITTAGLVLASSFALLAIVPVNAFREIAFAMAVGLLIDAFVVRSILVPALMTLVGPRSAWPGRRLRRSAPPRRIGIGEAPAGAG
jgi:RND superfamily putative drug exporter